jgi:truncated hemoglobin YjbI
VKKGNLKNLFKRIGSEQQLKIILDDFYIRMSQDILIGFYFHKKNIQKIVTQQQQFLMRAMGVIDSYQGKSPAHAHLHLPPILNGHFDRRLKLLEETLRDHGIDEENIQLWIKFENIFRNKIVKTVPPKY